AKDSAIKDLEFIREKYDSIVEKLAKEQEAKIKLEGETSSLKKQNEYLRSEIDSLANKIKEFENKNLELQKALSDIKSENLFLNNQIKELTAQVSNRPQAPPSEELARFKTRVKILEDNLKEKEAELNEYKQKVEKLQQDNLQIKTDNEKKIMAINQYLKEIEKFKEELDKNIEYQRKLTKLQYELNEMKSLNEKKELELRRIQKLKKMMESEPKFKILQILESVGEMNIKTLNNALGYTSIMTKKTLNELAQADLVELDGDVVKLKTD
ncbi:MAG: hypothetical protein ACTSQY_03770, partial [Candidatus Odinarchaeia archaeon]